MLGWAYLASEWLIRLTMTPIVLRRRRPSASLAWLLVIYLLPWVGLIVYALIGGSWLGSRRARRSARAQGVIRRLGKLAASTPHVAHPDVNPRQRGLVAVAERVGDAPILGGNTVEVIAKAGQVIERLIADIDEAKRSVHILVYIFANDATGRRVAEAMIRAVRRGVICRVLVDHVGSSAMLRSLAPRLRLEGIEVLRLLPVRWWRFPFARVDLRNHRKLFVIDGAVAYCGSLNIIDADYGDQRRGAWNEVVARLRGPIVMQCQHVVLEDWYAQTGVVLDESDLFPDLQPPGETCAQLVPSGPDRPNELMRDLVIAAIQDAERRIVITSPFLTIDEGVFAALRVAVLRNVRVDLVLPARGNHPIVAAAGWSFARDLAQAGVRVHRHFAGLLHAKTLSVDDSFAMIGSSNFDIRSFDLNFELNVLIYDRRTTGELLRLQESYIDDSALIDEQWLAGRGAAALLWDDLCRLVSPLL